MASVPHGSSTITLPKQSDMFTPIRTYTTNQKQLQCDNVPLFPFADLGRRMELGDYHPTASLER